MTRARKQQTVTLVRSKYRMMSPFLNERTRRLWAATEAHALERGGITVVAEAVHMSRTTIHAGLDKLAHPAVAAPADRVRRAGGGRKSLHDEDPELVPALSELVEPDTRGDPESPLQWTTKGTVSLAAELTGEGHRVSATTVSRLLHAEGFSLQANRKTDEGIDHPDRDAQFRYINTSATHMREQHQPVISVDTKKKELVGNFKNPGQEWRKTGNPRTVRMHDFADENLGKIIPYGVYDLSRNEGWVNVGITHDTASFAAHSIERWWHALGRKRYPDATELLITADCGGSNGNRNRLWKLELQHLADDLSLTIHVRHFPPGTSKWNKIEHRLFSFITKNWRGRPLVDRATVINLIATTKTEHGLKVYARLDKHVYATGSRVSDDEIASLKLTPAPFHGEWNYRVEPRKNV